MTNEEKNTILGIVLDLNFWTNYIKVLAKRETDEREEIIGVCKSMNKRIVDLMNSAEQSHITSKIGDINDNNASKAGDINDTISMAITLMLDKKPEINGLSKVDYIAKNRNITKDEAKDVLDHIEMLSDMIQNGNIL